MGMPGPAPKPYLQIIREGNPSKTKVDPGVILPPADLDEPDWLETFPASREKDAQALNKRAREVARREWRRVVPILKRAAGLGDADLQTARDYCICVARLDQCERELSMHGLLQLGQRGWQKNGATTIAGQYRTQLRAYIGELGLSPAARRRLTPVEAPDDDDTDPFD